LGGGAYVGCLLDVQCLFNKYYLFGYIAFSIIFCGLLFAAITELKERHDLQFICHVDKNDFTF
jgi:hypothetical protein